MMPMMRPNLRISMPSPEGGTVTALALSNVTDAGDSGVQARLSACVSCSVIMLLSPEKGCASPDELSAALCLLNQVTTTTTQLAVFDPSASVTALSITGLPSHRIQ